MSKFCKWFYNNDFKANPGKFHFLLIPFEDRSIKMVGSTIKKKQREGIVRSEN